MSATCHPLKPVYARGLCRGCYDQTRYERRPELRERKRVAQKEYAVGYNLKWREKKLAEQRARYADQDIAVRREGALKSRYGLTLEGYDALVASQDGRCAICRRPPRGRDKGKRLYVDHDHANGRVRGLLCAGCNTSLGQFLDDPEILRAAICYIEGTEDGRASK